MTNLTSPKPGLTAGNQALIRGDYDQALARYREALRLMPELGAIIKANIRLAELRRARATQADALFTLLEQPGWTFEQVLHWAMLWFRALVAGTAIKSGRQIDRASEEVYAGSYNSWVSTQLIGLTPEYFVNQPEGLPRYRGFWDHAAPYLPLAGLLYGGLLGVFTKITSVAPPRETRLLEPRLLARELISGLDQVLEASDQAFIEKLWQVPAKPALWAQVS